MLWTAQTQNKRLLPSQFRPNRHQLPQRGKLLLLQKLGVTFTAFAPPGGFTLIVLFIFKLTANKQNKTISYISGRHWQRLYLIDVVWFINFVFSRFICDRKYFYLISS